MLMFLSSTNPPHADVDAPKTVDEVGAIVHYCNQNGCSITDDEGETDLDKTFYRISIDCQPPHAYTRQELLDLVSNQQLEDH